MRVIYNASKGNRIKKGTYKSTYNRRNIFIGVTANIDSQTLYWSDTTKQWTTFRNSIAETSNYNNSINNLKQLVRHIKKQKYLPKRTIFVLRSKFNNYDITVIK